MKALYSIERWPHGWVICYNGIAPGIPISALSESLKLFPKASGIDTAIGHHLRAIGFHTASMVIATNSESAKWRAEIEADIAGMPPQERWWKGLNVGTSSAAMFAVFADPPWNFHAKEMGQESTPHDAGDFRRCVNLISEFPEWRQRLHLVAQQYPAGKWPAIIEKWDELETAAPEKQTEMLGAM